jgi:hypothetical protein
MSTPEFSTSNLYLAAWLVTRRASYRQHHLSFSRVQPRSANTTAKVFVFADPDQQGAELEREFMETNPVVRIHTLRAALNLLRDHLHHDEVQQGGGAR